MKKISLIKFYRLLLYFVKVYWLFANIAFGCEKWGNLLFFGTLRASFLWSINQLLPKREIIMKEWKFFPDYLFI